MNSSEEYSQVQKKPQQKKPAMTIPSEFHNTVKQAVSSERKTTPICDHDVILKRNTKTNKLKLSTILLPLKAEKNKLDLKMMSYNKIKISKKAKSPRTIHSFKQNEFNGQTYQNVAVIKRENILEQSLSKNLKTNEIQIDSLMNNNLKNGTDFVVSKNPTNFSKQNIKVDEVISNDFKVPTKKNGKHEYALNFVEKNDKSMILKNELGKTKTAEKLKNLNNKNEQQQYLSLTNNKSKIATSPRRSERKEQVPFFKPIQLHQEILIQPVDVYLGLKTKNNERENSRESNLNLSLKQRKDNLTSKFDVLSKRNYSQSPEFPRGMSHEISLKVGKESDETELENKGNKMQHKEVDFESKKNLIKNQTKNENKKLFDIKTTNYNLCKTQTKNESTIFSPNINNKTFYFDIFDNLNALNNFQKTVKSDLKNCEFEQCKTPKKQEKISKKIGLSMTLSTNNELDVFNSQNRIHQNSKFFFDEMKFIESDHFTNPNTVQQSTDIIINSMKSHHVENSKTQIEINNKIDSDNHVSNNFNFESQKIKPAQKNFNIQEIGTYALFILK